MYQGKMSYYAVINACADILRWAHIDWPQSRYTFFQILICFLVVVIGQYTFKLLKSLKKDKKRSASYFELEERVIFEPMSKVLVLIAFHWKAIPLRFEILVKMTRIWAETARAQ